MSLSLATTNAAQPPSAESSGPPLRIYLANDDHTDYMWTADAETYDRVFVEMLDYYLDLADDTKDRPGPYRSRFNADGSFWLWNYERQKSPEDFHRLMAAIADGSISAPLNALVSCYGGQPAEAVLRGMYYAGRLERAYGVRFPQAVAMENQTQPLGLASLWAGAGARYSWKGVCACASRMPQPPLSRREHEIYWYTGLDGQRVLMKWHSIAAGNNKSIGGYAEAFDPVKSIEFLESNPEFLRRYRAPGADRPYSVRGAFGFGWDALDRKTGQVYKANEKDYPYTEHFHVIAEEHTTADRQVIASNQEDFFADFESRYGSQIPSESVTHGNEWDLYSASQAETSARVRRSVEKLRAAEALATTVSLRQPDFLADRTAARDEAFMDLGLYWEHDWTADGPVSRSARAAWQEALADRIETYVDTLHADAATALGGLVAGTPDGSPRFLAFNPLGWTRTDSADFAYDGPAEITVHDLTANTTIPHQIVTNGDARQLRILATDLPPFGYKVYEIRPDSRDHIPGDAATFDAASGSFENDRVALVIAPDGSIVSLIDKTRPEHNLVTEIDGLALNDLSTDTTPAQISVIDRGPVSVTLECVRGGKPVHTTRITLHRNSERVDLHNEITENFGETQHWTFSFNLTDPDIHTEEVGAIIRLKRQADGGHYADRNARTDYATLNHFVDISDGTGTRGVTLSNADCAFVRPGRSTPEELDTATAQLNVLAGGQVDGPTLGIQDQNGETRFLQRFALRPHGGYDPAGAMRFALEHQNLPVTASIIGNPEAHLPATTHSLLTLDHPGVLVWAVKPAEEGIADGIIVRLWNVTSEIAETTLTLDPAPTSARRTTHVETNVDPADLTDGKLTARFAPQEMQTFRLITQRTP